MIICWEVQSAVLSEAFSPAHKTQRQIDPTLRLQLGIYKTLNALFGVAYDLEHLKSRASVRQPKQ
jgi:hypothetical protein